MALHRRPTFRRRTLLAGAVGVVGAGALTGRALAGDSGRFPFPTGSEFSVLVTGDAGTGGPEQQAVADAARALPDFGLAIGLGDNIYENGPETVDDPEFAAKFEEPNAGLDVPWLMVQGNHDNGVIPGTGGWLGRGQVEVEYHGRSRRWYMPERYYSVRVPEDEPVAEFFVIDTNPVASYVPQLLPHWTYNGEYMTRQRRWLRDGLDESPARWTFVCSHHPYLNNGPHGNAGRFDGITIGNYASGRHLKTLFEQDVCGRATAILSGHDHSLQVIEPTAACRGTVPVISGAAAKSTGGDSNVTQPAAFQEFDAFGFMTLDLTPSSAELAVHRVDVSAGTSQEAYRRPL